MLDVAPFGYARLADEPPAHEVWWEEPRDITRVVLRFPEGTKPPAADSVRILYWRRLWPEQRWEDRGTGADSDASGWHGWRPMDDWYHGEWQAADVEGEASEKELQFAFRPLAAREFPERSDYSVTFRQTMKLRVELPRGTGRPVEVQAFVEAGLAEAGVCVWWDSPEPGEGCIETYNCELLSLRPLASGARPEVTGPASWRVPPRARAGGLRLRLRYPVGRGDDHPDRAIATVRCPGRGFSFLVEPVAAGEVMHAPDLGVLVWPARRGRKPPASAVTGGASLYDRIASRPEQSYRRAMEAMPPRRRMPFVLGCEGGRQKFRVEPDGDLLCPPNFVARVPGRDTPRLKGKGTACYRFGLERLLRVERFVEDGYLPIIHTAWVEGELRVEQVAFAAPACASILAGAREGDDPVAAFIRFRFANTGEDCVTARLPVRAVRLRDRRDPDIPEESAEPLSLDGDLAMARGGPGGENWLRMIVSCADGAVTESGSGLVYEAALAPGAQSELVLKVPFLALDDPAEVEAQRAKEFGAEQGEVRRFWRQRVSQGCEIETPEQDVNDFHRAHLIHMLITNDREVGSDRIMTRVGSFTYGNYANESCMCISDLDRRGYHDVAARCLEVFLHYQGSAGLSGDFASREGQFYGSGGYEAGEYYVQHQGWVLWCLAEHYRYTQDAAWLERAAPKIVRGCEWIIAERGATMAGGPGGGRPLEHGFLPVGGLEDIGEWYHWLSSNAFNWWGLDHAAQALLEIGHPEGERLAREAEAYRGDLLAGFREASVRAPLVRLRDGSYVPHFPSRLYLRGRDFGWIRETLEGSIHLVCTGLVDANSDEAAWIVKDYEDNRYLSPRYGYAVDHPAEWWFDRGGFSVQPNLLWHPIAYLLRDDVPHYLRAYFNSLAVTFREDTRMCAEHPLPTFADWAGDFFKTSDEAQSTNWLRLMFVQELGEDLCLGRALPREWLSDGSRVAIRRAATHFGPVDMEITSAVADGKMTVQLAPPLRNPPARIRLRLRHPEAARIRAVEAEGAPGLEFQIDGDWIVFPPPPGPVSITASF